MKTDLINILLILISALVAMILPFELFLLSYAILGPLHYLTEISWLEKKRYFLPSHKDAWLLVAICSVLSILLMMIFLLTNQTSELSLWPPCLIFLAFAAAFIITFIRDWWFRINAFAIALLLALVFKGTWNYHLIFGIFLTTIIHVWLFTGVFILSGAVKSKAISAYFSLLVFLVCSLSFGFIARADYVVSAYAAKAFGIGNFPINEIILKIFGFSADQKSILSSKSGLKLQGFLAFAYTYHYLNWFSKVEIIKWHQVPKNQLIFSVIVWIASVVIYAFDYRSGFYFLTFLSMMHVFLEFPLNFRSVLFLIKNEKT